MDLIVNKTSLADLFRVTRSAIDLWERRGCPVLRAGRRGGEARYDLRTVIPWFRDWKDHNAYRTDLDIARTKLASAQERRIEFEMAKLKREFLPAEMVERAWRDEILRFRAKMLGLSTRLAAPLAAVKDPAVVKVQIDEHVHDALAELGTPDELPTWLARDARSDREGDTIRDKAAAAVDRQRVGRRKPPSKRRVVR